MTDEELSTRIRNRGEAGTQAALLCAVAKARLAETPEEQHVTVHAGAAFLEIFLEDTPDKYGGVMHVGDMRISATCQNSRLDVLGALMSAFSIKHNEEFNELRKAIIDSGSDGSVCGGDVGDGVRNHPYKWVFGSKSEGVLSICIELDWRRSPYEVVRMRGTLRHGFVVREFTQLQELQDMLDSYTGREFQSMVSVEAMAKDLKMKARVITGCEFPARCSDGFVNALLLMPKKKKG